MKAMIKYNRALDYMVEAMNEMVDGKKRPQVAASLMAKAFAEPDAMAAIKTIEATNKAAYAASEAARIEAAKRLSATEEMTDEESEFPVENSAPEGDEFDFDADPLDYVGDEEEEVPAVAAVATAAATTAVPKEVKPAAPVVKTAATAKAPTKTVASEMSETLAAMVRKRDGK